MMAHVYAAYKDHLTDEDAFAEDAYIFPDEGEDPGDADETVLTGPDINHDSIHASFRTAIASYANYKASNHAMRAERGTHLC